MVTGERQAARIRSLYLKAIMRQDVAFFDKEMNTGEVVSRMSGDTVLIQDAMGEKVRFTVPLKKKKKKKEAILSFAFTIVHLGFVFQCRLGNSYS